MFILATAIYLISKKSNSIFSTLVIDFYQQNSKKFSVISFIFNSFYLAFFCLHFSFCLYTFLSAFTLFFLPLHFSSCLYLSISPFLLTFSFFFLYLYFTLLFFYLYIIICLLFLSLSFSFFVFFYLCLFFYLLDYCLSIYRD